VIAHAPSVQPAVPWFELHTVGHAPQWPASVFRLISQPFDTLPSQLPYPLLQLMPHTPVAHVAVPFVALHTTPQPLQFAGLVLRFASQPFARLPSQLPYPVLQLIAHTPLVQLAVPLAELQTVPHALQFSLSFFRSASHPSVISPLQLP
jgi:hypothetical protein